MNGLVSFNSIKEEYEMIVAINYDFDITLDEYVRKYYMAVYDVRGVLLGYESSLNTYA